VYKSGIGDSDELNELFAALAMEVGLDARPARMADRDDMTFDKRMAEVYFLPNVDMAVMINGKWKIYDVSAKRLPPGMLGWREEGVPALIADSKAPQFMLSGVSMPAESLSARKATLTLSEDGTLEGAVVENWTGHAAETARGDLKSESEAKRTEDEKEDLIKEFPQAEISDLHLENVDDAEKPLELRYHIRLPQYAGRTGKRIIFQPLFFERNDSPLFTGDDRRYDISFHYAWQESDDIAITIPEGFELEKAENPGSVSFGPPGSYDLKMMVQGKRVLICKRELTFGNQGMIYYPLRNYPALKNIFDEVHRRDSTTFSLRKTVAEQAAE